ncbi:tRNA (adenosine(37)-N6)-threonylcarbamoyltransferase complex dimerization subunit type 1 TsaB [Rhodohalobacter sp. SW132]|uniref:tRNA (adenosine(37)-N6)-threonylcarbamoyltransferase complex dimerization subunit type 1 TsaB n=1 Tax=Rhodohalobacter sp. SW132 TaxID=2293433 RepID=UPI000E23EF88|nr:tRNA (adenosine(37)-N6)-threonylcarbamoyltransferase complex dimerization subunit type 1 TsaB [Rhodohalobacter sp. SW132]REL37825.1 tRNA (adenosine(37)-N6)-threonylcarbamoyltransferase complex dimerization subunit type 1 TsaB [Rhodohalobacter sp. SW132]
MIIAIETSTPVCSVALQTGAGRTWEKRIEGRGVHSERLFTFTKELLDRASVEISELDAILFSGGPGSYTGLRIGASAIKGFLYGRDVPFYTCPTLISFAAGLPLDESPKQILSVIDARRTHLYVQVLQWDGENLTPETDSAVEAISDIEKKLTPNTILVGTGWNRLNFDPFDEIQTFGTEAISAKNLITAWEHDDLRSSFKKEIIETYEPDYLELAQVNNSGVK